MATSTSTNNQLILVSAELGNTEVGQRFVTALSAYTEELREHCVHAPPETLLRAQGAARQATTLLRLIVTSKDEAMKLVQAEQNRKVKG